MKMKIIFIDLHCDATMPSGANEFGGGNTYSRGLLKGIAGNSNLHCIYITRRKYTHIPLCEQISENCFIERITLGDTVDDKDTLQNYLDEALIKIKNIISKYHLDKFIIHSSYWQSGLIALALSREYNTYYIHTIQSNGKKKKIVNSKQENLDDRISAEQLVFSNARFLICSSKAEQIEIHDLYDIELNKLVLTGLPIAPEFYNPSHDKYGNISTYSITGKSVRSIIPAEYSTDCLDTWWVRGPFLYYGRLHIDKGIPEIIKAWSMLFEKYGAETPSLWIAGGVPAQIAKMRKLLRDTDICIDEYEKQQKIIWWGTLSPSELSCLLTKAMVLVTHSKYESGGLMIMEALACSTPVIASPFGYAKDYIRNWYNGFIVDYGNITLLEMRMSHFIENPYISDLLSKNAAITYDKISSDIDFLKIHFDLYEGTTPNKPHLLEETSESNYVLGYQNIPNESVIKNIIGKFCKNKIYKLKKTYYDVDSIVWLIEYNNQVYRIDIWLTTLNMFRFFDSYEPYLITSTDKIETVAKLQKIPAFQTLEYFSIENKLSITHQADSNQALEINQMIALLDEVFQCTVSEIKLEASLSEKISALYSNINRYNVCIQDKIKLQQVFNILSILEEYNAGRTKLNYGFTPHINSCDNIQNNKLYGIFHYSMSEYGHGIAMMFSIMGIQPGKDVHMRFGCDEAKSISVWYVYLKLENALFELIHSDNKTLQENLMELLDYLK